MRAFPVVPSSALASRGPRDHGIPRDAPVEGLPRIDQARLAQVGRLCVHEAGALALRAGWGRCVGLGPQSRGTFRSVDRRDRSTGQTRGSCALGRSPSVAPRGSPRPCEASRARRGPPGGAQRFAEASSWDCKGTHHDGGGKSRVWDPRRRRLPAGRCPSRLLKNNLLPCPPCSFARGIRGCRRETTRRAQRGDRARARARPRFSFSNGRLASRRSRAPPLASRWPTPSPRARRQSR